MSEICLFSVESGNLSIGNIHWYTGLYLTLYTLCIRRQFFFIHRAQLWCFSLTSYVEQVLCL